MLSRAICNFEQVWYQKRLAEFARHTGAFITHTPTKLQRHANIQWLYTGITPPKLWKAANQETCNVGVQSFKVEVSAYTVDALPMKESYQKDLNSLDTACWESQNRIIEMILF